MTDFMPATNGSRRTTPLVLLLASIFLTGAATGVVADRLIPRPPVLRAELRDMSGVLERLQLTPAQRAQADSILARQAPRAHMLMLELAERLRDVADSVDMELRGILTPEQRARLDSLRIAEPPMMLKRKLITPEGTTVDTVLVPRDSVRP